MKRVLFDEDMPRQLQYQQNIPQFDIGVVVIAVRDTRLPNLKLVLPQLRAAIADVPPGVVVVVA